MINKIKNFDYQQFFINHGEKIGTGVVASIAVLAVWGTSWGRYATDPQEFVRNANKTREQMNGSTFPEPDREQYSNVEDIGKQTSRLQKFDQTHLASLSYSTRFVFPLTPEFEKIETIEFPPLENLIADPGNFLMPARAEFLVDLDAEASEDQLASAEEPSPGYDEEDNLDVDYGVRSNVGGGAMPAAGGYGGDDYGGDDYGGDDYGGDEGGDYGGDDYGGDDYGGYGGDTGSRAEEKVARPSEGVYYIALRGIFPLRKAQVQIADILHYSRTASVLKKLVIPTDFVIERKTMQPGNDPWGGDWIPVDKQSAIETLARADGVDAEVVFSGVTDPVLTMPLPPRYMGYWDVDGAHPGLADYKLSAEDQKLIDLRNKVLEELSSQSSAAATPTGPRQRGFSDASNAIGEMREKVANDPRMKALFDKKLQEAATESEPEEKVDVAALRLQMKQIQTAEAANHLLLFRFLDFTVEPDQSYRYRVRLEMANPVFDAPADMLADPTLAERETWLTDWTELGSEVHVPPSYQYFVDDVNEQKGEAELLLYQWLSDAGTTARATIRVKPGSVIGGKKTSYVLRPAKQTYARETVPFATRDVLIDIDSTPPVMAEDHPDLGLKPARRGYSLADEVLVLDKFGALNPINSRMNLRAKTRAENIQAAMRRANDHLIQRKEREPAGGANAGYAGDDGY